MTRYCVNATVSYIGWVYVEADSPDEAMNEGTDCDAGDFEVDPGTAQVEFNVTPAVESDEVDAARKKKP